MKAIGLTIGLILLVTSALGTIASVSEYHAPIINGDIGNVSSENQYVVEISTKGTPIIVTAAPFGPADLTIYLDGVEIASGTSVSTDGIGLHEITIASSTATSFRLDVQNDGMGGPAISVFASYLVLGAVVLILSRKNGGRHKQKRDMP